MRFISLNAPNVLAVTFVFPVNLANFLKESLHLLSCLGHLLFMGIVKSTAGIGYEFVWGMNLVWAIATSFLQV